MGENTDTAGDIKTEELLRMLFREHSLEYFLNRDETLFTVPESHNYLLPSASNAR